MKKINIENLNRELPDGYEAVEMVDSIAISENNGLVALGDIMESGSEYGYYLDFCYAALSASEISTYIEALKVVQKFMEEANEKD